MKEKLDASLVTHNASRCHYIHTASREVFEQLEITQPLPKYAEYRTSFK
jgi:hypothetical protein